MLDFRAIINDRQYLTTFIVGMRYVTVLHKNYSFEMIVEAIEDHLGDNFKKPFVIVSSTFIYTYDPAVLIDRDMADLVLEG